jgi:hypothetical protein
VLDLSDFARLRAVNEGRALPIAGCRRVERSDVAVVLCPLSMAGEDSATHTIAVGELGDPEPTLLTIPDPRNRERQQELFIALAELLLPHAEKAVELSVPFQVWVSSPAVVGHLFRMQDRMRFTVPEHRDARATQLGLLFRSLHMRHSHRGQQALMVAADVLGDHYASGQEPGEDAHLGAQLAWHEGNPTTVQKRVMAAEQQPMGVATDPQEDRELERRLRAFHAARIGSEQGSHTAEELAAREADLAAHLEPVARSIFAATQQAAALVLDSSLPLLPSLNKLLESEAFWHRAAMDTSRWMLDNDRMYGRWDSFDRAMKEHDRRERSDELYERLLLADPFVRQQAELDGALARCTIAERQITGGKGNSRTITMVLKAAEGARLRVGAVYAEVDDERLRLRIDSVRRQPDQTRVEVTSVGVQKAAADEVADGDELLLAQTSGDFRFIAEKARKRIFGSNLEDDDPYRMPFTHDPKDGIELARGEGSCPTDPLAALEEIAK